ncbi:hypothetical protein C8Q78DRAFT_971998 [Trametes maxima]|nr:hypothetical protein C8Q78DRAFT_971998 [Trametes maxima]
MTTRRVTLLLPLLLLSQSVIITALAQNLTIDAPSSVAQCTPVTIQWSGGRAPYYLYVEPLVRTPLDLPQTYENIAGQSLLWTPKYHPGALVSLAIVDITGATAHSAVFPIIGSTDNTCLGLARPSTSTADHTPSSPASTTNPGEPASDVSSGGSGARVHGLSKGAIAGIAVGCAAILSLVSILYIRRRRQVHTFRRRHRSKRSDWQVLADIPFASDNHTGSAKTHPGSDILSTYPPPPSPSIQKPSEAAPRRSVVQNMSSIPVAP